MTDNADIQAIDELRQRHFGAWTSDRMEDMMGNFTQDSEYHPYDSQSIRGWDHLYAFYQDVMSDYLVALKETPEHIEADGDWGTLMGLYEIEYTPKGDKKPIRRGGRYHMELRRGDDGQWRIRREITQPTTDPISFDD